MISQFDIKRSVLFLLLAIFIGIAVPVHAAKVQVFKQVDPEKEVPTRVMREKAVAEGFAQALLSESLRMIPASLSSERTEALRSALGDRYQDLIFGYKDMDVKQAEDGISVSIDVNVNRKALRRALKNMGMFASEGSVVSSFVTVSDGKYKLSDEEQLKQNAMLNDLMVLYAVKNISVADGVQPDVTCSVTHASKKRWTGELKTAKSAWSASGAGLKQVWQELWEKYYATQVADVRMNPKAVLAVHGWFNPEGVREFGKKLKSWDSAVQEVLLLDVQMKPTEVSASWSIEVSDQWVLRSYLNDYLPPRGLDYSLEGLEESK